MMWRCVMAAAAVFGLAGPALAQTTVQEAADALAATAPDAAWRSLDPENTLYLDLPGGQVVIELAPELAPRHVERVKTLARQRFYDGIVFHRVIENFMAQGGDPTGTGAGGSDFPDLANEAVNLADRSVDMNTLGRDADAPRVGFIRSVPVGGQKNMVRVVRADGRIPLWGLHCPGVMSMARADSPDSANSQFFIMYDDARDSLDKTYTVWGRVVHGLEFAEQLERGSPPQEPDAIVSMRVAADVPEADRLNIEVMRTDAPEFRLYVTTLRLLDNNRVVDICRIQIPSRIR